MPVRDLVSWNSLISGYSSHGYYEEALEIYHELKNSWIVPDSFTVSSVLPAFGNLLVVKQGQGLHGFALKSGVNSVVVVNNGLVAMYLKFRRPTDARRVFDEMDVRDSVSYNTMICGYLKLEMVEESVRMFLENLDQFKPDLLTVSSVLRACGHLRDLSLAKYIYNYMLKAGFVLESTVRNILIDVYAKCGDMITARDVFNSMECKDTVSWNSIISGYTKRRSYGSHETLQDDDDHGRAGGSHHLFDAYICLHTSSRLEIWERATLKWDKIWNLYRSFC
jgi:pentatricopeptide repeat protein